VAYFLGYLYNALCDSCWRHTGSKIGAKFRSQSRNPLSEGVSQGKRLRFSTPIATCFIPNSILEEQVTEREKKTNKRVSSLLFSFATTSIEMPRRKQCVSSLSRVCCWLLDAGKFEIGTKINNVEMCSDFRLQFSIAHILSTRRSFDTSSIRRTTSFINLTSSEGQREANRHSNDSRDKHTSHSIGFVPYNVLSRDRISTGVYVRQTAQS